MKKVGVAILGLGVVGGGTYKILSEHREFYKKVHSLDISVEGVLEKNVDRINSAHIDGSKVYNNIAEIISNPEIDIVVEAIGGIEPAKSYVLAVLNAGKTVVTSNKELYCKYSHELEKAAKKNGCGLFFEASCVGGVPVIRALLDNLQGNKIYSLMGIINGTTNYILTKMSDCGYEYSDALKEAQRLGFAEADSSSDVDGFDAAYKLSILASISFHTKVPFTKVYREGITSVNITDIKYGKRFGYVLKLLAIGRETRNGLELRVHPAFIKNSHPLASVNDSFNAVYVSGDCVGDVMLYGRGAGALPTGSAIVGDIVYCATHDNYNYSTFENSEDADPAVKFTTDFESSYYLRLVAQDRAGVLSKVSAVLSKHSISVAEIIQDNGKNSCGEVPLIIITHSTHEKNIGKVIDDLNDEESMAKVVSVIRVVD